MNKSAAYHFGQQQALQCFSVEKLGRYLTEEDRLERKMKRHEDRGYDAEHERLGAKGEASGRATGQLGGGLLGGFGGAALGSGFGLPGVLGGGVLGALGGHALGGRWGASSGRSDGEGEADSREELAEKLRTLKGPGAHRKHIEHVVSSHRAREDLEAQQDMASAATQQNMRDMMRYYRD